VPLRWNDVIIYLEKGRRTDIIPSVITVFIDELGKYVVPVSGFVVQKMIFVLPAGK